MKLNVLIFAAVAAIACTTATVGAQALDGGVRREVPGLKGQVIPFAIVDGGVDAGEDRRLEFRTRMDLLAMDVGIRAGETVVPEILFAIESTLKSDAAVVLMRFERSKEITGLFFYYDSVKGWQSFPADFR